MTVRQRLIIVASLAGVLYLAMILAGMGGFELRVWLVMAAISYTWHLFVHEPDPDLKALMGAGLVHVAISAFFVWIGSFVGWLTGFALPLEYPAAAAIVALLLARMWRVTKSEAQAIEKALRELEEAALKAAEVEAAKAARAESDAQQAQEDATVALLEELRAMPADAPTARIDALSDRLREAGPEVMGRAETFARSEDRAGAWRVILCLIEDPGPDGSEGSIDWAAEVVGLARDHGDPRLAAEARTTGARLAERFPDARSLDPFRPADGGGAA